MNTVVQHPVTAKQEDIIQGAHDAWKAGDVKSMVIILIDKDDSTSYSYINLSELELLGLLTKTTALLASNAD